jgi:hypothetical protein
MVFGPFRHADMQLNPAKRCIHCSGFMSPQSQMPVAQELITGSSGSPVTFDFTFPAAFLMASMMDIKKIGEKLEGGKERN